MNEYLRDDERGAMRAAGKVAARFLKKLRWVIKPGITTADIEVFFENFLTRYPGMEAAFKGFSGYPAALCVSLNDEVIHGIPSTERIVRAGDLVSVDIGIRYRGIYVDTARTYAAGKVSAQARTLLHVTHKALREGIRSARCGATVGDVGWAIQRCVESHGFSVIRKFVGHGIGRNLHCAPEVPNFGSAGAGSVLKEYTAIAIEPMVAAGHHDVHVRGDGWTATTSDGSLSAHWEHTVLITARGPWVITE
ncbi:MAG: type I methionyl aminopeptidase [Candidatus Omnitrophota bacterium]